MDNEIVLVENPFDSLECKLQKFEECEIGTCVYEYNEETDTWELKDVIDLWF